MAQGWGHFVDPDLKQYLEEVTSSLSDGDASADSGGVIVKNVLEEIQGKELRVATDTDCSHYLEKLIRVASPDDAAAILTSLSDPESLLTAASNPFGSHVLETLLRRLAHEPPSDSAAGEALIEDLVQHVKGDIEQYISDRHATFFARALLQLLTGTLPAAKPTAAPLAGGLGEKLAHIQRIAGVTVVGVPFSERGDAGTQQSTHGHHVRALAQVFLGADIDDAALVALQRSVTASPFLQALLRAVDGTDEAVPFFLRMLGAPVDSGEAPAAAAKRIDKSKLVAQMKNKASSHFIEAVLLRTPASVYDVLYTMLKPKLPNLCVNPIANFAAQSLIAAAPSGRFVADMLPLLKETVGDTIRHKRSGVACVLAVASAAWRTACEDVAALVQAALPDGVVASLAMLDQADTLQQAAAAEQGKRAARLSTNGCILLQALLAMPQSACKDVSDALVALPAAELAVMARDSAGARVLEAFLKGSAPKPMKKNLLQKLEPSYSSLASLPAPSRLVEALFVWGDVSDKEVIARALAPKLRELQGSKVAAPLCQVCQLEVWARSEVEWRRRVADSERTAAQFQKLFGDTAAAGKKARKKKRRRDEAGRDERAPAQQSGGERKKGHAADVVGEVMAELGIAHVAPGGATAEKKAKRHKGKSTNGGQSGVLRVQAGSDGADRTAEAKKKKKKRKDKDKP